MVVKTFDVETYDRSCIEVAPLSKMDVYEVLTMRAQFHAANQKLLVTRK
jgi:hypothetical protein